MIVLKQRLTIEISAAGSDELDAREKLRRIRQQILNIEEKHSLSWSSKISRVKGGPDS